MNQTLTKQQELVVELNGNVTYANTIEIQLDLEMALYHFETLVLDITNLEKLDEIGVELLLKIKNKARLDGKEVIIFNNHNEITTQTVRNLTKPCIIKTS